jgi:hypothetical protein
VEAEAKRSGDFRIPRPPGEHVLSVFFDIGQVAITRECRFWVGETIPTTVVPLPASIEFWLDPGWCGNRYAPGSLVYLNVGVNREGWVEFTVRPLFGDNQDIWYPISDNSTLKVTTDQPARMEWILPEANGNWILRATLNQGEAEAMCDVQISEMNPPTLSEIALVPQLPCENQNVDAFVFVKDDSAIESVRLFNRQPNTENFIEVPGTRLDDFSYQFTLFASQEAGSQFYLEIRDVNGNLTTTQADPYSAYSGFISSGIDYEGYCNAYLVWPKTDLYGMDVNYTPPIVYNMVGCMMACVTDLSCQSFTYSSETNGCWLKNGVPGPSFCETCTSAKEFTVPIP